MIQLLRKAYAVLKKKKFRDLETCKVLMILSLYLIHRYKVWWQIYLCNSEICINELN